MILLSYSPWVIHFCLNISNTVRVSPRTRTTTVFERCAIHLFTTASRYALLRVFNHVTGNKLIICCLDHGLDLENYPVNTCVYSTIMNRVWF
jgi:hypothetical protein